MNSTLAHRFIQLHTLTCYSGVNLNRDDTGLSKRLMFGGHLRTMMSSQCKKYYWRHHDGEMSLTNLAEDSMSYASRDVVARKIMPKIVDASNKCLKQRALDLTLRTLENLVYGQSKDGSDIKTKATVLLGEKEIQYLTRVGLEIAELFNSICPRDIGMLSDEGIKKQKKEEEALRKELYKKHAKNLSIMRENTSLPAGIHGAAFGRMVTADYNASIRSAIYASPSISVHAEESEVDFVTMIDDLISDKVGITAFVDETELNSSVMYGYTCIDVKCLIDNLGGDLVLAKNVVNNLIRLVAEVSPGGRRAATAPFTKAHTLLVSKTNATPQSYIEAYRKPVAPNLDDAMIALDDFIGRHDEAYGDMEVRGYLSLSDDFYPYLGEHFDYEELLAWATESGFDLNGEIAA